MPATVQSLRLTDAYRVKLSRLTKATQREARAAWKGVTWDDITGSYRPVADRVATSIIRAQREAVRLTAGYLGAYLSSELGTRVPTPLIATDTYIGKSYGNLPLRQSLDSPRVVLLVANEEGKPDPMGLGLRALLVNVDLDVKHAARQALQDAMEADDRIIGWRRAVKGTCAACLGAAEASTLPPGTPLEIHPNCECVSEPVLQRSVENATEKIVPPGRGQAIDQGIAAINDVHGLPDAPAPTVAIGNPGLQTLGSTEMMPSGQARITIAENSEADTVLHEFGHAMDGALGDGMFLSKRSSSDLLDGVDEMQAVLRAIRKSDAYKTLTEDPDVILAVDPRYAKEKVELFARAYAQWIGEKKGVAVGSAKSRALGLQWSSDDFRKIGKALDNLFRAKGLLK